MSAFSYLIHYISEMGREGTIRPILKVRNLRLKSLPKAASGSPVWLSGQALSTALWLPPWKFLVIGIKIEPFGNSLVIQWLGLCPFTKRPEGKKQKTKSLHRIKLVIHFLFFKNRISFYSMENFKYWLKKAYGQWSPEVTADPALLPQGVDSRAEAPRHGRPPGDQSHITSIAHSSIHARWVVGKVIATAIQVPAKARVTRLVLDP